MHTELIISGFGGQGALFAGQLLAFAAMGEGKHVTWLPSYGPEMRGGTAHCIVIVSDDPIGSPIIQYPDAAIVMNNPSMDRYEALVKPSGVLVVNSSLVTRAPVREDIRSLLVPANELAEKSGSTRTLNVVLLGALLAVRPIVGISSLRNALREHLPDQHRKMLDVNLAALEIGEAAGAAQVVPLKAET